MKNLNLHLMRISPTNFKMRENAVKYDAVKLDILYKGSQLVLEVNSCTGFRDLLLHNL